MGNQMKRRQELFNHRIFGERLTNALKERNVTKIQLSKRIGVCSSCVSNYCLGRNMPDCTHVAMIAVMLDVSANYLLGLRDDICRLKKNDRNAYITERIQQLLENFEINNSDMAKRIGTNASTVCCWTSNQCLPMSSSVENIANTFEVSVDWILGISDVMEIA